MRIVFTNAFKTWNLINWIIAAWTGGKYSHCEFIFRDGKMFGASFIDNNCRWKKYYPNDALEVFNFATSPELEDMIRNSCMKYHGKNYDYLGLLGYIIPTPKVVLFNHKGKYYCSELVAHMLEKFTCFRSSRNPSKTSPNTLFRDLKRNKYIK